MLDELDLGRGEVDSHAVVVMEEKEYQEERYMGEGGVWESTTIKDGRVTADLVLVRRKKEWGRFQRVARDAVMTDGCLLLSLFAQRSRWS